LCSVSPIRFNVLTHQRFNGGEADYTLLPLLLDPFYGVQGKFLTIFGSQPRMDTNNTNYRKTSGTTDYTDFTDEMFILRCVVERVVLNALA